MTEPATQRGFPLRPSRLSRGSTANKTTDNTAAALLLTFTVIAILWANSPWAHAYSTLLETDVGVSLGEHHVEMSVKHLVNDALMTFFFFIVGLEVTREFTIGELTDRSRAAVPVVAAIAGLVLPAVVFLVFNPLGRTPRRGGGDLHRHRVPGGGAGDHQAGVPRAGPAVPADTGRRRRRRRAVRDRAVLLRRDSRRPLVVAVVLLVALALVRYLPKARGPAYAVLGVALWIALYLGGVHPTLAGVAVALLIPVFTPERRPVERAVEQIRAFRQSPNSQYARAASRSLQESISINERLQTTVGPIVSFGILPLFALVNAGCGWTRRASARRCAPR